MLARDNVARPVAAELTGPKDATIRMHPFSRPACGPRPPPRPPDGLQRRSACFDSGATAATEPNDADLDDVRPSRSGLITASGQRLNVAAQGTGTMYAYDTCGNLQSIPRGRTLVEKSLHRLLSPKSMLTAPDAAVQEARLSLDNSFMQLHNGARVPLRWDGKSWYLDYFACVDLETVCTFRVLAVHLS